MVNTADIREFAKDTEATITRAKATKGTGTFTRFHAGSYFYVDNNDTVWHIFYRPEHKDWVVCDFAKDDNVDVKASLSLIRSGFKHADSVYTQMKSKSQPESTAEAEEDRVPARTRKGYPIYPDYQRGDRVMWEGNLMMVVATHGDYYDLAYMNPRRCDEPNEEMVGVSVIEYADDEATRNHWTYAISGW